MAICNSRFRKVGYLTGGVCVCDRTTQTVGDIVDDACDAVVAAGRDVDVNEEI